MYKSNKAKQNSHAVRQCTSHTTFGVSMERVFGVSLHLPGDSDPVPTLIDSGATCNFIDSSSPLLSFQLHLYIPSFANCSLSF